MAAAERSPLAGDPGRSVNLDRLTQRELGVLRLVADGLSNEAVAVRLHISVKTVEALMASVFRHLDLIESWDVNRRVTAAVAYVYREVADRPVGTITERPVGTIILDWMEDA